MVMVKAGDGEGERDVNGGGRCDHFYPSIDHDTKEHKDTTRTQTS